MSLALLCAIVLLASTVETVAGFGKTLLAVALGAQLWPIEQLLPAIVPLNLVQSAYIVLRHRSAVDGRLLARRILPWMGTGLPLGLAAFQLGQGRALKLGFAAFVVLLSALELVRARTARSRQAREPLSRTRGALALLAAGVVHGLYATGGPLLVYFAGREPLDKRRFRSTLATVWLVTNSVLLASYAAAGRLDADSLGRSAALLLPALGGIALGEVLHARVDEQRFRTLVFALLLAAGGLLALRA